jgi:hypothetical protein
MARPPKNAHSFLLASFGNYMAALLGGQYKKETIWQKKNPHRMTGGGWLDSGWVGSGCLVSGHTNHAQGGILLANSVRHHR